MGTQLLYECVHFLNPLAFTNASIETSAPLAVEPAMQLVQTDSAAGFSAVMQSSSSAVSCSSLTPPLYCKYGRKGVDASWVI